MLGEELRKARESAGLTQEELAHRAGIHRTYVSLLERGRKSPPVDVLLRLCAATGVRASNVIAVVEASRTRRSR